MEASDWPAAVGARGVLAYVAVGAGESEEGLLMVRWEEDLRAVLGQGVLRLDVVPEMPLSAREEDVAALIARGLMKSEIAVELGITESTVKSNVRSIVNKIPGSARGMRKIMLWMLTGRTAA